MKKFSFFVLSFLVIGFASSYSQENNPNFRELGLSSTTLTSGYGVTYNWGKSDFLWSLRGTNFTGSIPTNKPDSINYINAVGGNSTTYTSTSGSFGFGLNFGFEKYMTLTEKLWGYWGVNGFVSYSYSLSKSWTSKSSIYSVQPGIGLRLGMMYAITPHVCFRADINPNVYYSMSKTTNNNNIRKTNGPNSYSYSTNPTDKLYFSFTNTGVTFTLSYRFLSK
jgi:hypothetical protein